MLDAWVCVVSRLRVSRFVFRVVHYMVLVVLSIVHRMRDRGLGWMVWRGWLVILGDRYRGNAKCKG